MEPLTPEEVRTEFERTGAILSGHFQLTSGRHSDTYVQCARVLEDSVLTTRLAAELAGMFEPDQVDLVAAPAVGGIIIGFAVAQALGTPLIFSEREDGRMTFRRGFDAPAGARVLVVEDVVTTGGSVAEVVDLVRASGADVVGVAALIDRGGEKAFDAPYRPLLRLRVDSWETSDCALCAAGEALTSPGSRRLSG